MNITCAACGQVVSISKAGGKCPKCGVAIAGVAAAQAVAGAAAAADDLLDRLLLEVKNLGLRARAVPATTAGDFDPGVFPEASEAACVEHAYGRPTRLTVMAVVLIAVVGCLAFVYIRSVIRNQTADAAVSRAESDKKFIKDTLQQADAARAAKGYKVALADYRAALDLCVPLLARLHDDTAGLSAGQIKERANAVETEVQGYLKRAQDGAQSPEVVYGSQGRVLLEDGQWMTPEQKDKMFQDRMKREGRTLVNGEWLTGREIHERKGEVLYQDQWITKEAYALILAQSPTTAQPPKPAPPKPSTTFLDSEPIWLLDDFAKGAVEWTNVPRDWKATPANLTLDKTGAFPRLLISMLAGSNDNDKSAIVRPLALDLRSRTSISMDVFNETGEPMRMAIAVGTGKKDDYYEGRWLTVKAGENKGVQFTLQSSDFKCAPNWTHSSRIGHPEAAHWLYILIYNYGKPGNIYLGNVSALGGP